MELNRRTIAGQAFPRTTDGYDREAVDRHLDAIADAVEKPTEPVGADAGEQMRSIVEGAERSAQALRDTAQREADELRESARAEAEAMRDKAARESGEQVAAARAAVKGLLQRVEALRLGVEDAQRHVLQAGEAMAQRLGLDSEPLVATLRERAEALGAELDLIGSGLASHAVEAVGERVREPVAASTPPPPPPPAPAATPQSAATAPPDPPPSAPGTGLSPGDLDEVPQAVDIPAPPSPQSHTASAPAPDAPPPGTERARLVALNMAVSGTPRAEAERHLRDELSIEDPSAILDEVYSRTGGEG